MLNEQTIVKWDKNAETDLRNGLTKVQVKEQQTIYGPNRLREGKKKSVLKLFWEQLNDPLIYILMAAIAISLFLGSRKAGSGGWKTAYSERIADR